MFTPPKNGLAREAPLTEPAREAIVALPVEGEFCFAPIRSQHWTASARAYHWKAVRGAVGWAGSLYLATRHFRGLVHVNELDLFSGYVAIRTRAYRWRRAGPQSSTGTATTSALWTAWRPRTGARQASRRCGSVSALG
jgi:hypothetical protein